MVVGFLKGLWGKPTQKGSLVVGLWGTVTNNISNPFKIFNSITTLIKWIIITAIGLLLYKRYKK